jgi:KDO2-lipid IV(A) lauroyltransferase
MVEAAWQRGEGILFLTPHLGCFEITAQYYAAHAPITVLYRPPKQAWLQPLIESGRGGSAKVCTWRRPTCPACACCSRR